MEMLSWVIELLMFILNLKKIGDEFFKTIKGIGYKFVKSEK